LSIPHNSEIWKLSEIPDYYVGKNKCAYDFIAVCHGSLRIIITHGANRLVDVTLRAMLNKKFHMIFPKTGRPRRSNLQLLLRNRIAILPPESNDCVELGAEN
jgi:hypothetical protein